MAYFVRHGRGRSRLRWLQHAVGRLPQRSLQSSSSSSPAPPFSPADGVVSGPPAPPSASIPTISSGPPSYQLPPTRCHSCSIGRPRLASDCGLIRPRCRSPLQLDRLRSGQQRIHPLLLGKPSSVRYPDQCQDAFPRDFEGVLGKAAPLLS